MLSNYFYREMSPLLRWLILPFLLLSGLTTFVLVGAALEWLNITSTNIFLNNRLLADLGILGSLVQMILTVNAAIFVVLIALSVPLYLIWRDVRTTLQRFHIVLNPADLSIAKEQEYLDAARAVFERDPETIVFIYGHTHIPSLRRLDQRVVINTGTWLKQLQDVPPRFGFLPEIYVPSFCLNYFKIKATAGKVAIEYHRIDKDNPQELSLLQRLLVSKKRLPPRDPIPEQVVLQV
ncbi:MAG: hypothetical protein ACOC6L_02750 [Thermodesulfobacteriota bacterium]